MANPGATLPWESYLSAAFLKENEFEQIRRYDVRDGKVRKALFDQDPDSHALLMLDLLENLPRTADKKKYMLNMVDDCLSVDESRVSFFLALEERNENFPFNPFLDCLQRHGDEVEIFQKASKILTGLLCAGGQMSDKNLTWFLEQLVTKLKSANESLDSAIFCLTKLFLIQEVRVIFFGIPTAMAKLVEVLRMNSTNFQIQYQVIFCLWLLAFQEDIAKNMNNFDVVGLLSEIIRSSIKEKVVRVCLLTLRNLLEKAPLANLQAMNDHKVMKLCETISGRNWTDEDMVGDFEFIIAELRQHVVEQSSWDEYTSELRSGKLTWSPVHKSETFWRQNALHFHDNNYEVLKQLQSVLMRSTNSQIVAVAVHDIGEYVRVNPRGKTVLEKFNIKSRIMDLLSDEDAEVRYHALLAVQKYMVNNWEYLQNQNSMTAPKSAVAAS